MRAATTTPERWQLIEALYHAALDTEGAARQALLSQSDPDVKRAVEALLVHEDSESGVLDRPAWELASEPPQPARVKLAAGDLLGPYRVDSWVGAGGMGDVYRATDTRLNRTVAVKVSAAQFSARFEREARTIAALNHPNICQIYDIGPNYLVMEYVVGAPVVAPDQRPMPREQVLERGRQMAAAIEAAHAKGIVHRDLKPANILVTDEGAVKLLDFGIAKRNVPIGVGDKPASVTHMGMIMGTPAYMSPEQAEGGAADARSDLFSVGAILYEMLAGKRAFPGASVASTLGAVLHRSPDPLDIAPDLAAVVLKCLAKAPADRFQTAADLRKALEYAARAPATPSLTWLRRHRPRLLGAATCLAVACLGLYAAQHRRSSAINSIAVLPLDMQSNDPDADYIAEGIAESINNRLARVPGLRVIPNSVALQYQGHSADYQKIGAALGIDAVLSGRAVQRGDDLTINIELNDVRRGTQVWGQRYTRKTTDLLMVQGDIAREVSQHLSSQLALSEDPRATPGSTANPEAYQLFLKGEFHTGKFTQTGFAKGIDYLNQAVTLDPGYAAAYSALAYNYINQDDWFLPPVDSAPKARQAALKALSLEETDVRAHVVLGIESDWYEWDWARADQEFRRAIDLDPEDGDARGYYSWFLPSMGRNDEAVEQARAQLRLLPLATGTNGNMGSVLVFTQRWDEAIAQLRAAIDLNPNYWFDYYFLGRAFEQKGQLAEATETLQRGLKLEDNTELWGALGHAYAVSGRRADALQVLEHLDGLSKTRYVAPYNRAVIQAGLGDNDAAFQWLERAFEARSYLLAVYLNTDARLKTLYGDPRYDGLRQRMKLPAPK